MPLIEHVNWKELDQQVLQQQRNRAAHSPVISLFRWWARRPHSFAGAILDAATSEFGTNFLVADPFSGGGTVAVEAARRGLAVYAQDLYPWPSCGLATALTRVSPEAFERAASEVLHSLSDRRRDYWTQPDSDEWWETTHIIRVRKANCTDCASDIFLFRDALISLASRKVDERWAFFGCMACGAVSRRSKGVSTFGCGICHRRTFVTVSKQLEPGRPPYVQCPHCHTALPLASLLKQKPVWHPVLVREHRPGPEERVSRIRPAQSGDQPGFDASAADVTFRVPIPEGIETGHLKRQGFVLWRDLYTSRQLATLHAALRQIDRVAAPEAIKRHLRLAALGATEMAGYICRWERFHPKAVEAISNHRFSRTTVVVETNLLSPSGRGTLPRRFEAVARALRWMRAGSYPARISYTISESRRRKVKGALIVTGSGERQLLRDGDAQLIFTDPPYHDDLQYGELARLFHAWMQHVWGAEAPDEKTEAVPNPVRGTDTRHYERIIAGCLAESNRTLAADGRLILTFHNKDLRAWEALAGALRQAQFFVIALATVLAENSADHSKRGKQTFLSDLVIECRPRRHAPPNVDIGDVRGPLHTPERRNLAAIGLALAEFVNGRPVQALEPLFLTHLRNLGTRRVLIRRGGS